MFVSYVMLDCLGIIGPILWGHSGPLCHALSSSSLWTSMRRRHATVAACDSSDTWWMAMRRAVARSGEWAQHFSTASCCIQVFSNNLSIMVLN